MVPGADLQIYHLKYKIHNLKYKIHNPKYQIHVMPITKYTIQNTKYMYIVLLTSVSVIAIGLWRILI